MEIIMRLFVSVPLTDDVKKCVLYHRNMLKEESSKGRYPHSDNYHITLAFIGEYDNPDRVLEALGKVRQVPFNVTAGGIGKFGRTYFVRVSSETGALESLAEKVRGALKLAGIPFDRNDFKAHITFGRDVECQRCPAVFRKATMTVSGFSLMRSDVINGKRIYRSFGQIKLK